jgi:hypothetical protein
MEAPVTRSHWVPEQSGPAEHGRIVCPAPAGADFRSGATHAKSRAHRKVGDLAEPVRRARSSAVEHLTFNQVVVGSIPTGLTIDTKK